MFDIPIETTPDVAHSFIHKLLSVLEEPASFLEYKQEMNDIELFNEGNVCSSTFFEWAVVVSQQSDMLDMFERICWAIALRSQECQEELLIDCETRLFEPFAAALLHHQRLCDDLLVALITVSDMDHDVTIGDIIHEAALFWANIENDKALGRLIAVSIGRGFGQCYPIDPQSIEGFSSKIKHPEVESWILKGLNEELSHDLDEDFDEILSSSEIDSFAQIWSVLEFGLDADESFFWADPEDQIPLLTDDFWQLVENKKVLIRSSIAENWELLEAARPVISWEKYGQPQHALSALNCPPDLCLEQKEVSLCQFVTYQGKEYFVTLTARKIFIYDTDNFSLLQTVSWSTHFHYLYNGLQLFALNDSSQSRDYQLLLIGTDEPPILVRMFTGQTLLITAQAPHLTVVSECRRYLGLYINGEMVEYDDDDDSYYDYRPIKNIYGGTIEVMDLQTRQRTGYVKVARDWSVQSLSLSSEENAVVVLGYQCDLETKVIKQTSLMKIHQSTGKVLSWCTEEDLSACEYRRLKRVEQVYLDSIEKQIYCVSDEDFFCFSLTDLQLRWQTERTVKRYSFWDLEYKPESLCICSLNREILMLTNESDGSLVRFKPNGKRINYQFPLIEADRSSMHCNAYMCVSYDGKQVAMTLNDFDDNEDCVRVYDLTAGN
ncbi:hypothetical protein [Algicola sagamiensis]|uniref:hypothetical protein n=1 Tax=Algicola sagamiensis TaxID=163869 RepID=UPI00037D3FC3|nr:hypothetical protein [Algicola sagamiensis]